MVIWQALSCMVYQSVIKTVCFLLKRVYAGICRNVGCPLVILVGARLGIWSQQCAGASSVDLQLVTHVVTVCQRWHCQCIPWYVWKLFEGSEENLRG